MKHYSEEYFLAMTNRKMTVKDFLRLKMEGRHFDNAVPETLIWMFDTVCSRNSEFT